MGRVRFVQPEIVRLPLSEGDWIEVKKRLTVGEERKAMAVLVNEVRGDGRYTPNLEMMGKSEMLAYIVDWSFRDAADKPVKFSLNALDSIDPETFKEIDAALDAHKAAMAEERDAEKKMTDGASASPVI